MWSRAIPHRIVFLLGARGAPRALADMPIIWRETRGENLFGVFPFGIKLLV